MVVAGCLTKIRLREPGRWTVDMFAIFHLGRPNVLPVGDLAVRKGLTSLYKLKVSPFEILEFGDGHGDHMPCPMCLGCRGKE
jgi:hypothetical protein